MKTKRAVDILMTFLLLFLMSYQVTEQAAHEWLGMGMTVLVILHQILNRKWYAALFRGKYGAIRAARRNGLAVPKRDCLTGYDSALASYDPIARPCKECQHGSAAGLTNGSI
ncbi:MAG: hypothetical protein IKO14_03605 [Oscillibacter sp.]|nr:hypothetical protein [Oscillibacter sp.]